MSKWKLGTKMRVVEKLFWEPVKVTNPSGKKDTKEKDGITYKKVWRKVLTSEPDKAYVVPPVEKFEWPAFRTESERIKHNSLVAKQQNLSITESFAQLLGINIQSNEELEVHANIIPTELHVGDELDMIIRSVSKDRVEFECVNLKQEIYSSVNLYRYQNFKRFVPQEPVRVRVVAATPQKITVNPVITMVEGFINPIITDPTCQKVLDGEMRCVTVKNLRLTRGGFLGQAVIPTVSAWVGEDYTVDAFIPGSQIVLNIEKDFTRWEGKTIQAFITNYIPKTNKEGVTKMSLICSVKERLKFEGEKNILNIFKHWCEDDKEWNEFSKKQLNGIITGVIHTSKKCGIFVEIPDYNVTGFVNADPSEIGKYAPQTPIQVTWVGMEENTYYDEATKQNIHSDPFIIEDGVLKKCYVKPILKFVK